MAYLNITRYSRLNGESGAEPGLFGFKSFSNCTGPNHTRDDSSGDMPACLPATMDEAAQRPIYTVLNQRRVDLGCPMFGDILVVFATEFTRPMTVRPTHDGPRTRGY